MLIGVFVLKIATFIGGISAICYFIEKLRKKPDKISKIESAVDEIIKNQQSLEKSIKPMISPSPIPVTDFLDGLPQLNDTRKKEIFETGMKLRDENKPMEAIKRFRLLLSSNPLEEQRSALLILIGNSFIWTGNQDEALGHYKEALKAAEKSNNPGAKSVALGNIGLTLHIFESIGAETHISYTPNAKQKRGRKKVRSGFEFWK